MGRAHLTLLGLEQTRSNHVVFHLQGGQTSLLHMVRAAFQEDKLHCASTYELSICITFAYVSLAKVIHASQSLREGVGTRKYDSMQVINVTNSHRSSLRGLLLLLLPILLMLESCYSFKKFLFYLFHILYL